MRDFKNLHIALLESSKSSNGIYFIENIGESEFLSYEEIYNGALNRLHILQKKGVKQGDELLIATDNNIEFLYLFWGCMIGGIIAIPIKVANKEEESLRINKLLGSLVNPYIAIEKDIRNNLLKYAKDNAFNKSEILLNEKSLIIEELEDTGMLGIAYDSKPEDIAIIQFSSGSTGTPNGIVLTHKNLISTIEDMGKLSDLKEGDVFLSWLPLTHNMGLIGLHMMPLINKFNQILIPPISFMKKPEIWLETVNRFRVTSSASPNFGFKHFIANYKNMNAKEWDLSCLKRIYNGAEPISMNLCREFYEQMKDCKLKYSAVYTVYGLAEATLAVAFPKPYTDPESVIVDRRFLGIKDKVVTLENLNSKYALEFAVVGYNLEHCEVSICDEENNQLNEGEIGLINIRGDNISSGYYKNSNKLTREDGWLNTGDLGFIIDGKLIISGRFKEIIFLNGQNFYPFDVERICASVKGVSEDGVIACGCFNINSNKDDLLIFIKNELSDEKFIELADMIKREVWEKLGISVDEVIQIEEVPKTASSKVARFKLIEQFNDGQYDNQIKRFKNIESNKMKFVTLSNTEETIVKLMESVLNLENINVNDNLFKFGLNSISLVEIFAELEKVFPNKLKLANMFAFPTIKKLAEFIDNEDKISLKGYRLQERFLTENGTENSAEFNIGEENYNLLKNNSIEEHYEVNHLIISIIVYVLSQLNDEENISVQVMLGECKAKNVDFDLSEIEDLFSIIDEYKKLIIESTEYSIFDINKLKISNENNSTLVLIYEYDTYLNNLDEFKLFGLTFGIENVGNNMILHISSNKEISNNIISVLLNVISQVVEQIKKLFYIN